MVQNRGKKMSAKTLFYPEGKQFSRTEDRAFAREALVYNVTEDILLTMEDRGISKKELASRMGKSRAFVSQVLSGARNMTLGSFSDICFAIGVKPSISLVSENSSTPRDTGYNAACRRHKKTSQNKTRLAKA